VTPKGQTHDPNTRDLGVVIDSQLSLSAQVAAVCCSGYYHLRQLRPLVRSMSAEAVKTLVQAFISFSCLLDYCNSLFYGIAEGLMSRLLSVQNVAARLVSGARRYDHITPVLQELDWLPVRDGHPGLPVTVRHGSSLSGRRLPDGLRQRSSSVAFCHIEDVRCEANLHQLWRQVFCSCRSEAVEQPSN